MSINGNVINAYQESKDDPRYVHNSSTVDIYTEDIQQKEKLYYSIASTWTPEVALSPS